MSIGGNWSSNLFQGASSGSSGSGNFFADYANIKNGSYRKLMKTYYGKVQNSSTGKTSSTGRRTDNILDKLLEEKRNPTVSKGVQESNAKLTTGLSSLKGAVSALQKDSTYEDTENGTSAADKVVSAVKTYVSTYNDVVNAAKGSTLRGKTAYVANMMSSTAANSDKLAELGIKVNRNGTLELNESKLKAADTSKVKELFSSDNIMSYGSTVASRLHFAGSSGSTGGTASAGGTDTDKDDNDNKVTSAAAGLKADGKALAEDELYAKVKDKDGNEKYDVDKIFAAAQSFVKNYNKMFDDAESSPNSGVVANLSYIRERTARSTDTLKQFGIDVDKKGRLKIDEDTFKKADMSEVQKFFKDYGSSVSSNASLVDYYMTTKASAANSYTADGTYDVQGSARFASTI